MRQLIWMVSLLAIMLASCKDDTPITTDNGTGDNTGEIKAGKLELIIRKWKISDATHDGVHDGSSTGKTVDFQTGASYNFNGSFDGTYRWSTDSTTLYLDESTQYAQTWKIVELSEQAFEVDFNSPFTGKPSNWKMNPWP